ncbi:alpha/beta hydrolase family protein [Sphingomonas bacterium]|uniref:alpha/beta hydrolase family protein n=1 Tax=Sphingomonas bacterium TaxID=1895847 RepID=UPI0020C5F98B|nr:S9 family peptidase [Sphingomonas bacterium]
MAYGPRVALGMALALSGMAGSVDAATGAPAQRAAADRSPADRSSVDDATRTARLFGTRENVRQISLSPGGKRIAILRATAGASSGVYVYDVAAASEKLVMTSSGRPDQIVDCSWITDARLLCQVAAVTSANGLQLSLTRLFAMNADGGDLKEVSAERRSGDLGLGQSGGGVIDWLADGSGAVLVTRAVSEQYSTGTLLASHRSGVGVEQIDTTSLQHRQIEPPAAGAIDYLSDGHGTVRVMGVAAAADNGYMLGRVAFRYRQPGGRGWQPLSTVTVTSTGDRGFEPYAVDRDLNAAYGFDDAGGRQGLYRVSLDGSGKRELVLANPRVDVDELLTIGRQRRVVGASFATDKRENVFFDPELKTLGASLGRALPTTPIITFVDASADEKQLVLFAGSDSDPGRYYLYDKPSRHLAEIMAVRPGLADVRLASVRPVTFKAADGTDIPAYLTLPPGSDGPGIPKGLPAIVMPHGGPSARDEWGFDWLSQFFASRGYAVLQPNYRGSSGYGSAWFQKNGFQSWRTAIGDVNDAGRYLLASGIAAPGKLAIVGWSYGGYAALQSAALDPDLFKAIVAVAPVTDLETLRGQYRYYTNYRIVDAQIGHGPEVRAGSPAQNADRIKAPVLMFHGDLDTNVGVGESRLMASRLRGAGRRVDYVEYKGLTHQLDDADVRADLLGKSDAFLRRSLGLEAGQSTGK